MSLSVYDFIPAMQDTDFVIGEDDFNDLSINPMPSADCYWFKNAKKSLVKRFVLKRLPRVEKSCVVTLAKNKDGTYSPRFDFQIYDTTKKSLEEYKADKVDVSKIKVKAKVDISDCHEEFSALLGYMMGLDEIELEKTEIRTVTKDYLENLEESLKNVPKDDALQKFAAQYKGKLTDKDVQLLLNRKAQLDVFSKLLNDKKYFEAFRKRLGENKRPEDVWQYFFEHNQWIFGYGLKLVSCESLDDEKLEKITTGANVFTGAGKRADGLLRSRGYISSLLFCEIKTDEKDLLETTQYRKPDVYRVSDEVSGGVSQVQKTAHKALRTIASEFHRLYEPDGTPLRVEISTIRPRQVLVIGNLKQLLDNGEINLEKSLSFELYRKSINDVEVITFDELYERAKFIVDGLE
jgi:hypothetical protein